jgi:hypothetical protein
MAQAKRMAARLKEGRITWEAERQGKSFTALSRVRPFSGNGFLS